MPTAKLDLRIANGQYKLIKKCGSGSFGEIFIAESTKSIEYFAVKLEIATARYAQLMYESKIYKILSGGTGIPEVFWAGVEGEYNAMVMEKLGPSLEDLF